MQPGRGPEIEVAVRTHVGHVRQRNEDCAVLGGTVVQAADSALGRSTTEQPLLVAVLDGLGGHPDGNVASRVAGHELAGIDDPADVGGAMIAAHHAILAAVDERRGSPRMGTTVAVAVVADDGVTVGSIGDSSIMRVGIDGLEVLTPIDRARFGGLTAFAGDTRADGIEPHVRRLTLDGDVRLLLATDGLTDELPFDALHRLARPDGPVEAAAELVDAALGAGGHDNVTVAVVDVRTTT